MRTDWCGQTSPHRSARVDGGIPAASDDPRRTFVVGGPDGAQKNGPELVVGEPRRQLELLQHGKFALARPERKRLVDAASSAWVSRRSAALAFPSACSDVDAFGIAKTDGRRTRNRSAT